MKWVACRLMIVNRFHVDEGNVFRFSPKHKTKLNCRRLRDSKMFFSVECSDKDMISSSYKSYLVSRHINCNIAFYKADSIVIEYHWSAFTIFSFHFVERLVEWVSDRGKIMIWLREGRAALCWSWWMLRLVWWDLDSLWVVRSCLYSCSSLEPSSHK
jgi:hypothetical protein